MQSAPASSASKHSRACGNCSRAKAKCIPQANGDLDECARCFRLKKQCVVLPKPLRKKRAATSNSAQLEQKIEKLVNLLSAQSSAGIVHPGHLQPREDGANVNILGHLPWNDELLCGEKDSSSVPSSGEPSPESSQGELVDIVPVMQLLHNHTLSRLHCKVIPMISYYSASRTACWLSFVQHPAANTIISLVLTTILGQASTSYVSPLSTGEPSVSSPDILLRIFIERYTIHLPYVVILPNTRADELCENRPWLYRTVLVVASSEDRNKQIEVGMQIVMEISSAMIMRGERSLDMLQALLVYNSWAYYVSAGSPQSQSNALSHLAIALLFDLCLNQPLREDGSDPADVMAEVSRKAWSGEYNTKDKSRSPNERRALLYCFYLSSVTSLCMRKMDGLSSSPYIDYSCQALEEVAECEMDLVLVACVRLQSVIDSINRNLIGSSSDGEPRAPAWMHTSSVRSDLQKVLMSLSPNLQSHPLVRMSYHSAEIFLYGSGLYSSFSPNFTSQRIDMLYACLLAAKSLLEVVIEQPSTSFHGFPAASLSQIGHACSTLFKLSLVEEVGWDLTQIRQTFNLSACLDQMISKFEQAGAAIDLSQRAPSRASFPTGCSRALAKIRSWYVAKITPESEIERLPNTMVSYDTFEGLNWNGFDYLDDTYWQEIIGDMNFMQQQESMAVMSN